MRNEKVVTKLRSSQYSLSGQAIFESYTGMANVAVGEAGINGSRQRWPAHL